MCSFLKKIYLPLAFFTFFCYAISPSCFAQSGQAEYAPSEERSATDILFLQAFKRVASDPKQAETFLIRNRNYPLLPWLEYGLINNSLESPISKKQDLDPVVLAFITRYKNTYLSDKLAQDWLIWLAKHEYFEDFSSFLSHSSFDEDTPFKCLKATVSLKQHSQKNLDAPLFQYLLKSSKNASNDNCSTWISTLVEQELLSTTQLIKVLLLFAEQNDLIAAQSLLPYLPKDLFLTEKGLRLAFRPERKIPSFDLKTSAGQLLMSISISRLAIKDIPYAAQLLEKHKLELDPNLLHWTYGQIGIAAMKNADMNAYSFFSQSQPNSLTIEALNFAWRAFLVADNQYPNYSQILSLIDQLPDTEKQEPAARYWYARSIYETASQAQALQLFKQLSKEDDFYYGWLAKEFLHDGVTCHLSLNPHHPNDTFLGAPSSSLNNVTKNTLLRVKKLSDLQLYIEATKEWGTMTKHLSLEQLIEVGKWAQDQHLYIRSIAAGERAKNHIDAMELRYPFLYRSLTQHQTEFLQIPEPWVLGLVRQESRFMNKISSSVGAMGLMQIMPSTGKQLAKKEGVKHFSPQLLLQPELNVRLGSVYMKDLLNLFSGSFLLATASYNAGPTRPKQWIKQLAHPIEGAVFAEHIPFTETRSYVKSVLSNTACYQSLLEQRTVKLSTWLGSVQPPLLEQ